MKRLLLLLALALSITSCTGVDVARYADQQPALNLEQFFSQPGWRYTGVDLSAGETQR